MTVKYLPMEIYPFRSVGANLQFLLALTGFFYKKFPTTVFFANKKTCGQNNIKQYKKGVGVIVPTPLRYL